MVLLADRVGSHRVRVRHTAGCSLAAHSPAVAGRSPGLAAAAAAVVDNRAVGSRPDPSRVVGGDIGLGAGIAAGADSPGCTGRKGRTLRLCYVVMREKWVWKGWMMSEGRCCADEGSMEG